ncbi:hypothetical protein ACQ4PT_006049 [Festuca glaucescens]
MAKLTPSLEQQIGGELPAAGEVLGDPQLHASGGVGKLPKKIRKKKSSEACGVQKGTSDSRVEQRDGNKVTTSLPSSKKSAKKVTIAHSDKTCQTAGTKRPLSEASGSSRAKKASKMIDAKVATTQLQNKSTVVGRKMPLIVSRSPMINRMARQRAQSHGSPSLHAMSPNVVGTLKLPSLHDLSPAATNGHNLSPDATNGTPTSVHDLPPTATIAEFEENMDMLSQEGSGEEVALADSSLSDWQAHIKLKVARCRNELQQYIEEGFHPCTSDFNILKWWDVNSERYPILGNMARDVLDVPASTVASESAFSTCGRVITDHRSSLALETVEALMCYGDWIRASYSKEAGEERRCEE